MSACDSANTLRLRPMEESSGYSPAAGLLRAIRWQRPELHSARVRDIGLEASAIPWQGGRRPGVWARKAVGAIVGSLASCGRLAIGQPARWRETAAVGNRRAECRPAPRRSQRFHFYVAHPFRASGRRILFLTRSRGPNGTTGPDPECWRRHAGLGGIGQKGTPGSLLFHKPLILQGEKKQKGISGSLLTSP